MKLLLLPALFIAIILPLTHASAQLFVSSNFSHEVFSYHPDTGLLDGGGPLVAANGGGIMNPHGILDRADGSGILVASFGTAEVKRFNRLTGAFIDDFVPNTAGLSLPVYLELGPDDGHLYISSQGNDRIFRFNAATGAAVDVTPFIDAGLLDAPSGFDWSPDGTILYVAGRNSANVLAYDAATGAPLAGSAHEFATGLSGGNDTFGLAVHDPTGDVFVAANGDVLRFNSAGGLQATIPIPGLAIGIEPQNGDIYVAASNNLYVIDSDTNAVTGPFLTGGTINVLNFFHFSRFTDARVDVTGLALQEVLPGQDHFAVTFTLAAHATMRTATLQFTEDFVTWTDAAAYTPNGTAVPARNAATNTVQTTVVDQGALLEITERDAADTATVPARYYRLVTE